MKKIRICGIGEAYYHITTRVVDKVFRFTPEENERNVILMRKVEAFSAVQVVAYCFMSNHLHILLRVPVPEKEIQEEVLLSRIEALYGSEFREGLVARWEKFRANDCESLVQKEQANYVKRMYSLPEFMRTLKLRLTLSYNLRHDREGTLWESRYNSVFVESTPKVLSAVAAYIDLNPIRGGMVSDPMKYRFSSYGEACRGGALAQAGLCRIYQEGESLPGWKDVAPLHRTRLLLRATPTQKRAGMTLEAIQEALRSTNPSSLAPMLTDKCSFFTKGTALGDTDFLREVHRLHVAQKINGERMTPKPTVLPSTQAQKPPEPC